jgi:hypothetical protein
MHIIITYCLLIILFISFTCTSAVISYPSHSLSHLSKLSVEDNKENLPIVSSTPKHYKSGLSYYHPPSAEIKSLTISQLRGGFGGASYLPIEEEDIAPPSSDQVHITSAPKHFKDYIEGVYTRTSKCFPLVFHY